MNKILISSIIILILSVGIVLAQPFGLQKRFGNKNYSILSRPNGRFVFGQISDSSKDQYMLDTLTGRLWRLSENSEVGKFLLPIPYQKKDGTYSIFPYPYQKSKKNK